MQTPQQAEEARIRAALLVALQNELADKARSDGNHDFGSIGPRVGTPGNVAFSESIPGSSVNNWDEPSVLRVTFNNVDIRTVMSNLTDLATTASYPIRPTAAFNSVGPYTIKRVNLDAANGRPKPGSQLYDELGLTENHVLQVDFNQNGFLSRLKSGDSVPGKRLWYLWSAATVNDPASKTPPNDTLFTNQTGITLIPLLQTSGTMTFPGGKPFDPETPAHNFISTFDVELSGIIKKVSFGRRTRDIVSLKFTQPLTPGARLDRSATTRVSIVDDSKGQNSPAQLTAMIIRLLQKIGAVAAPPAQTKFELGTKWQQKRSGDWLQVLAAKLLKLLALQAYSAQQVEIPTALRGLFVSHDQIAIAYALEVGLDCLFINDRAVFRISSQQDDSAAQLARAQAVVSGMRADRLRWWNGVPGTPGMLEQQRAAMEAVAGRINGYATAIDNPTTLAALETAVKGLFKDALKYVNLEKAFPEESAISAGLSSTDPLQKAAAYLTIDALYIHHRGDPNIPPTFYGALEKTMVWKSIDKWTIEATQTFSNRLLSLFRGSAPAPGQSDQRESDVRDRFLFLPYIQNSKNIQFKDQIAQLFRRLETKLQTDELLERLGRTNDRAKQRVRSGLVALCEQAYVFLKTIQPEQAAFQVAAQQTAVAVQQALQQGQPLPPGATPQMLIEAAGGAAATAAARADQANFANAVQLPTIAATTDDPYEVVNPLVPASLLATKATFQTVTDSPDDADAFVEQTGGMRAGSRSDRTNNIDSSQCVDPILYAYIDFSLRSPADLVPTGLEYRPSLTPGVSDQVVRVSDTRSSLVQDPNTLAYASISSVPSGFAGGRRSLYSQGGRVAVAPIPTFSTPVMDGLAPLGKLAPSKEQAMPVSQEAPVVATSVASAVQQEDPTPGHVLRFCGILAGDRILRDTYKLVGACADTILYYSQGIALLSALSALEPTPENARAVRAIVSYSAFMLDTDYIDVFGMDPFTASTVRLFFSALEENQPVVPPKDPAADLRPVAASFKALWEKANPTSAMTVDQIRNATTTLLQSLYGVYGVKYEPPGQPSVDTASQSAGRAPRRPLYRTRRNRKSTTP